MQRSGNREVTDDEKPEITPPPTTSAGETKDIPFKKPVMLHENMKPTSIKEVLEKHQPQQQQQEDISQKENPTAPETAVPTSSEEIIPEENIISPQEENRETPAENHTDIPTEEKNEKTEETGYVSLQDCWQEAIKEAATQDTMIAEELLLKQTPRADEENRIGIDVSNEVAKQEIREFLPALCQCLLQKTGVAYTIDVQVVKVEQEKQVDRSNPDAKFKQLCLENPKLLEFKQRLDLSIS
ncbi:MAG: hypothetical protein LBH82_03795 [Bacteroidales bacterium]|nr:hypothetical protein [Bacteroidales bacterium]